MSKILLSFIISLLVLTGCGGGSDSSSNPPDSSNTPPEVDTNLLSIKLPTVEGRELITDIASIDLNQDGVNDLVLVRIGSDYAGDVYFQALINSGNDTFEDQTSSYFENVNFKGYSWVEKIYLVDLNNDGKLDIVSHHDQSHFEEVKPMIQKLDGEFEFINLGGFNDIGSFVPIDADNDGDIDLMVHTVDNFNDPIERNLNWKLLVNNLVETGSLSFSLGNGSIPNFKGLDNSTFIYSPVVLDINFDGLDDIFYGGPKYDSQFVDEIIPYSVLINEGANSFIDASNDVIVGSMGLTHVREISTADFNGDTYMDILISSHGYDSGALSGEKNQLLLGDGTGKLVLDEGKQQPFNYLGFTHSHDFGDIDGDGDIDIILSDITGSDVDGQAPIQILLNDGNANFSRRSTSIEIDTGSPFIVSTKLTDLNDDGFLDLVVGGDDLKHPAVVVWNNGSGSF